MLRVSEFAKVINQMPESDKINEAKPKETKANIKECKLRPSERDMDFFDIAR